VHTDWWAIKLLNYDLTEAAGERRSELSELDEIRDEAYESAPFISIYFPRNESILI